MDNFLLGLRGERYNEMIHKFRSRQEQTNLQEALVYLKLRDLDCSNNKALIFAKKKEKCIDGTITRDGPPGYRKLEVLKPDSKLINGWLRGEKLRYSGTTGYTDFLQKNESAEKREISRYNQKSRAMQEQQRKARSKSTVAIDLRKPRQSLEKIGLIKEDASKERQNRNMFVEYCGVRLDQTTKNFFKDAEGLNEEGLVIKLKAFEPMIADHELSLTTDQSNLRGKSLTHYQVEGTRKRENIISYQKRLRDYTDGKQISGEKQCFTLKRPIVKDQNDQKHLFFTKSNIDTASNPLILMNTKSLERQLAQNEKKCVQNLTKYSNFHRTLEKAVKIEFLNNRKYSSTQFGFNKRRSLNLDKS